MNSSSSERKLFSRVGPEPDSTRRRARFGSYSGSRARAARTKVLGMSMKSTSPMQISETRTPDKTRRASDKHLRRDSLFAVDPSKAYFEKFSLVWAPISLCLLLVGVFATGLWRYCGRNAYLFISVAGCIPGIVWPILYPCEVDRKRPYAKRFWVKAAVWVTIFSFYGNYFWTHYFYTLLGAQYLFDSYELNGVPLVAYFCTYFYFTFYFAVANVAQRLCRRIVAPRIRSSSSTFVKIAMNSVVGVMIFFLAVLTAVFEAVSVEHFPLYTYKDRTSFLTIGSVFYGIYFMVGFPMFFALDERQCGRPIDASSTGSPSKDRARAAPARVPPASMWHVVQNALAAVALVTVILDFWRLVIGDIYSFKSASFGVPFIYQAGKSRLRAGREAFGSVSSKLSGRWF